MSNYAKLVSGLLLVPIIVMKKTFLPIIVLGLMIPPVLAYSTYREGLTVSPVPITESTEPTESTDILGATDDYPENQIYFTVNIPATFNEDISAPNIVYSVNGESGEIVIDNRLVAGSGISVDGRTITNTGILTLVAGTGITVDGSTITNSGITSLSAGTNISIDGSTITNTYTFTPDYTSSGWTDNGSTVTLTTTTDSVTVADFTSDGITITNANSILPDTDLGSDLGSTTLRFNNLWVANINSNSSQSFSGQTTFSYPPTDTTIDEASVLINPTTSAASGQLLGLAIAGYQKALIDEDGDIILGYSDATSAPASDYPLNIYGHSGTRVSFVDTSGNAYFSGNVGIGTTSPNTILDLSIPSSGGTTSPMSTNAISLHNPYSAENAMIGIRFKHSTSTEAGYTPTGIFSYRDNGSTTRTARLGFFVADADNLVSADERMTINSSGNVGVGTTSPTFTLGSGLEIQRDGIATLRVDNNTNSVRAELNAYTDGVLLYTMSSHPLVFGVGGALVAKFHVSGGFSFGDTYDSADPGDNNMIIQGNVGIGTTDPSNKLQIVDTANNYQLSVGGTGNRYDIGRNNTDGILYFYGTQNNDTGYVFGGINGERMRISKSGQVGIGTTAPQSLLDVQGEAGSAGILTLASKELTVVDGDILGRINFNAPLESDGTDSLLVGASIWAEADDTFSTTVNSTELVFGTGTSATATEAMRIDSAGNVGIGTTGPISKLQIGLNIESSPNIPTVAGFYSSTDSSMIFRIGRDTTTPRTLSFGASDASGYAEIQAFQSKTSWSNTPLVLQRQGGNVGIGTAEPVYKLEVNGGDLGVIGSIGLSGNFYDIDSSYINITDGINVSGTSYFAARLKARGGIENDYATYLTIDGGTSGYTYFNGNVGIGTTAPGTALDVVGSVTISTLTTGTVYSNSGVLTNTDPSDENLKNNILTLEDGTLDKLLGLRPVSFDWKSTGDGALGFIAQEVDQVFPELVGSNNDGTLGLYTTQFIPVLAKAIQEQQMQIDGLGVASEIGILEGLVAEIRSWIEELQGKWEALAESLTTKEMCVGEGDEKTCLTRDQVDELIMLIPSPTPTPEPSSTPEPSVSPTPSPEPSIDPEASGSGTL